MMEITERASKYADGKANEAITTAIAQAYMDGYRDGYKDREEEIPVDLRDNKTEYVDLGLPSGTLWSTDFERDNGSGPILYLPYEKASKFKLPTMEQWQELEKECIWNPINIYNNKFTGIECVGPNGAAIHIITTGYYKGSKYEDQKRINAWMVSNEEYNGVEIFRYVDTGRMKMNLVGYFIGCRLPVRQVR